MANSFITRTVRGETKKRLSIEGSYIDDTFNIGTSWTKIRIGMRFSVTRNSSINPFPLLFFGLASSSGNVVGQTNPKHFLGIKTRDSFNSGYGSSSVTNGGSIITHALSTCRYVSGTLTQTNIGNSSNVPFDSGSPVIAVTQSSGSDSYGLLYGYFIEITKGSPNYNILAYGVGNTSDSNTDRPLRHLTDQKFLDFMDTPQTGINQLVNVGNTDYAINETTNGTLDTVNVCWQASSFPIEIANIGVKVLA